MPPKLFNKISRGRELPPLICSEHERKRPYYALANKENCKW